MPETESFAVAPHDLTPAFARDGHVFLRAKMLLPWLRAEGGLADWPGFADSWNGMPIDEYMADAGRYRRRRYGVFSVGAGGAIERETHQPHYQSRDYNALNGGVARWFEPIPEAVADSQSLRTILEFCRQQFGALALRVERWHVEVHQFRIEANADQHGLPTPEGVHRDGVDYVLVLLIRRQNIASGTTTIHTPDGRLLGSFTLTEPGDASLLDDARVFHGVTAVTPVDTAKPAYRDVLVVTWRSL